MSLQAGFALSHYKLLHKIGEGGMGVVWKAEDTILSRTVAIKVLPADVSRDDTRRQMFLQEARSASSVSDARIVQVYEFGREGDLDYIVMEYVEGQPLSKILHGRPLSPDKIAEIGFQAARALSKAHRSGLLHRDLKPGNILVTTDGEVKVVDFGLATLFTRRDTTVATEARTAATTETLPEGSEQQRIAGTLPYMSPEQVRGEKLDSRSDVFSFGAVLYEMSTGQRPFSGRTNMEVAEQIQRARPRLVHEVIPSIPLELSRIIDKALAARPSERYQTMEDLAVDLKRLGRELDTGSAPSYEELERTATGGSSKFRLWSTLAVLTVAGIFVALGWFVWIRRTGRVDPHSILILPMEVRGQGDGADYVGRAFSEILAMNLSQVGSLRVFPVPSENDLPEDSVLGRSRIARQLQAGFLLAGALTREGKSVTVDLNLVSTVDNRLVWGTRKTLSGNELEVLAVSMAQDVEASLDLSPPRRYEMPEMPYGTPDYLASPLLAEARRAFRSPLEALEAKRKLVEAFPHETHAHVILMMQLWGMCAVREPSSSECNQFEASLSELNRLDPSNPWDDMVHGYLLDLSGKGLEAETRFTHGLARSDLSPRLRSWFLNLRGQALVNEGRMATAIKDYEEALRLSPLNIWSLGRIGFAVLRMGRTDEGLEYARRTMAIEPDSAFSRALLGKALESAGNLTEALPYYAKNCDQQNSSPAGEDCSNYGLALAKVGRIEDALSILSSVCADNSIHCANYATALQMAGRGSEARMEAEKTARLDDATIRQCLYSLASYHAVAGHRAEALAYLRRDIEYGDTDIMIASDPIFKSLHDDPQFEGLMAEIRKRINT